MNSKQLIINHLTRYVNQIINKCIKKHIWLYSNDIVTGIQNASFSALGRSLLQNK